MNPTTIGGSFREMLQRDELKFSLDGPRPPLILNGVKMRLTACSSLSLFASITHGISASSSQHQKSSEIRPAFTQEQLWLQEQLGKIPLFSRFADQAKELREKKETEVAWKGHASKELRAVTPSTSSKDKKDKKFIVKKPKDLIESDIPIWNLFVELDADGNGTLDEGEMMLGLERMGLPSSPQAIVQLMGQFDEDGKGSISWSEFRGCISRRNKQIREAFNSFDLDGNGEITGSEMAKAMALAGLPVTGKDVGRMMHMLDKNQSSSINYEEFRRFACLVPSIYRNEGDSIRAWLASNARNRPSSSKRVQHHKDHAHNTTGQFLFVAFDLGLRASLAIALVSAALYITSQN